jgi:hypothetical protein
MKLTVGYADTSTDAFTIAGTTPVTVSKTSGNDKITWNGTTKKLDIAAGLAVGEYPVRLRASNAAGNHNFDFMLTVEEKVYYLEIPSTFTGGAVATNLTPNPFLAVEGQTVTLTITPDAGYELESITVTGYDGKPITLSGTGTTRIFVMPAQHIRVVAVFNSTGTNIENITDDKALKALTQNGTLFISGLTAGNAFSIYNLLGTLVYQGVTTADKAEIPLPGRGIYIITHNSKTIKTVN